MPNEMLLTNNGKYSETKKEESEKENKEDETKTTIEESDILSAMRVNLEEERNNLVKDLQVQLTDGKTTTEEKNNAYEQIKLLEEAKGKEEQLEKKIKNKFKLDSFIRVDQSQVTVVIVSKEHDKSLANNIMRSIQEEYQEKMYITVKFEK